MAVTFYNTATGEAIRLHTSDIRPGPDDEPVEFFESVSDEDLIIVQRVRVDVGPNDLPGKPRETVVCESCGERIHDGKQVEAEGRTLCKMCAGVDAYYTVI
jgi:formylmethanofuran dehydrogenase subunit E